MLSCCWNHYPYWAGSGHDVETSRTQHLTTYPPCYQLLPTVIPGQTSYGICAHRYQLQCSTWKDHFSIGAEFNFISVFSIHWAFALFQAEHSVKLSSQLQLNHPSTKLTSADASANSLLYPKTQISYRALLFLIKQNANSVVMLAPFCNREGNCCSAPCFNLSMKARGRVGSSRNRATLSNISSFKEECVCQIHASWKNNSY